MDPRRWHDTVSPFWNLYPTGAHLRKEIFRARQGGTGVVLHQKPKGTETAPTVPDVSVAYTDLLPDCLQKEYTLLLHHARKGTSTWATATLHVRDRFGEPGDAGEQIAHIPAPVSGALPEHAEEMRRFARAVAFSMQSYAPGLVVASNDKVFCLRAIPITRHTLPPKEA